MANSRGMMFAAAALAAMGLAGVAAAGPYEDGIAALSTGDAAGAAKRFETAAAQGDARAEFNLAQLYLQGEGVPQNPTIAADWFRKAAALGNAGAQFQLAQMLEVGHGVRRDNVEALRLLRAAASQDYASADDALAAMYAAGRGLPRDADKAAALYRQAADQGDAEGEFQVGLSFLTIARSPGAVINQTSFRQEMDAIFGHGRWRETGGYRTPARENELRAEGALTVALGHMSQHSLGTPDAPGAYDIVVDGLTPDLAAAKLHHSGAAFRRIYAEGLHGDQGPHLHIEPYPAGGKARTTELAEPVQAPDADAGASPTQPTPTNVDQAMAWFRKAAAQGNAGAAYNLGLMFEQGEGTPKDTVAAAHWYLEAAKRGELNAQVRLATIAGKGDGMAANPVEARMWLDVALASGRWTDDSQHRAALQLRDRVSGQMSADDRGEADRLAAQWAPPKGL